MSRYNAIDSNITNLTQQLNRATEDRMYDEGYERGAAEKPLTDSTVELNESEGTMRAFFGLLLEGDWLARCETDPDSALESLESALVNQAKLHDYQHRY